MEGGRVSNVKGKGRHQFNKCLSLPRVCLLPLPLIHIFSILLLPLYSGIGIKGRREIGGGEEGGAKKINK